MNKEVTIILPVYGRGRLLREALNSIDALEPERFSLLIADDGSDDSTAAEIQSWISTRPNIEVNWIRRSSNLGLFANLNSAIEDVSTEWIMLLCSDDLLKPNALVRVSDLQRSYPNAELILSTFESINEDGKPRSCDSGWHHDQISKTTRIVDRKTVICSLLQLGSINGNLTGMVFKKTLWSKAGKFKEEWRHAADWEWLVRAADNGIVLLNRIAIAKVRTHDAQLSNSNRNSGHETREVGEVVRLLIDHEMLRDEGKRFQWAGHVMQFQLWNSFKACGSGSGITLSDILKIIHKTCGLRITCVSLVRAFPERVSRSVRSRSER